MTAQQLAIWLPGAVAVVIIVAFLVLLAVRAHKRKVTTGNAGIIGETGIYRGGGKVFVHGELWTVESREGLAEGDKVVVEGVERMILRVRKLD